MSLMEAFVGKWLSRAIVHVDHKPMYNKAYCTLYSVTGQCKRMGEWRQHTMH